MTEAAKRWINNVDIPSSFFLISLPRGEKKSINISREREGGKGSRRKRRRRIRKSKTKM